jgi:Flp pilus assembly protein TadD
MNPKKSFCYQVLRLSSVLFLGLMASCADSFDQASEKDITSSSAGLVHLGDQMHAGGDDQGAMEFYARAIQHAPGDEDAHQKLAALLETHGDTKDAAEQYRILTTLAPDNIDYHRAYGRALIILGQPADAEKQYEAALAIDSSDVRALNGLGVALDLIGDHAGAQDKYKHALEEKPDDMATINNLGHSYVLAGSYDDAIQLLEPHEADPAAPATLRENLAEAYGMNNMMVDAERVMRKDLTPEQLKKKLARFRAAREKTALPIFANLGAFATADLAKARLDRLKEQFTAAIGQLDLEVVPEVDEEGGTPTFFVRAAGFKNTADAHAFCKTLKKDGAFCNAHEG